MRYDDKSLRTRANQRLTEVHFIAGRSGEPTVEREVAWPPGVGHVSLATA